MLLLIGLCPALAARFPDAVEKKIVLVGRESASVARARSIGVPSPSQMEQVSLSRFLRMKIMPMISTGTA
jgi:hypothetical protein